MADELDVEAMMALLPKRSTAEDFAEIMAARQRAQDAPPAELTIIPMPEYRKPLSGVACYPCALGCGWVHEEDASTWQLGPVVFRPEDPDSLARSLTENAERRGAELRERIESAIREHFTAAHPGLDIPTRSAW
ncbi:hypothetical protein [Streptomyces sp. NPDC047070]|uniref:hypothetical protein n=1 Tax=Streptomyces sp. NPDC047070 TaxID=3154923 RepID=UPI00345566C2